MIQESVQAFVPAYNEKETIGTVLDRTHAVLKRNFSSFELLAYDDGSTDGTGEICDSFARGHDGVRVVHRERNGGGWGPMVSYAYRQCAHDWIVIVDSDMQFDPNDLERFVPYLKDHDLVISGRLDRKDGWARKAITWLDKLLLRLLFSASFYDLHWIKFVRTSFVDKSTITGNSPFVETDILIRAKMKGARIKQFHLPHYPREHGVATGASLRGIVHSLRDMTRLFVSLRRDRTRGGP